MGRREKGGERLGRGSSLRAPSGRRGGQGRGEKKEGARIAVLGAPTRPHPRLPHPPARTRPAQCTQAGIRVIVITGDNKKTAEAICTNIGVLAAGQPVAGSSYTGGCVSACDMACAALGACINACVDPHRWARARIGPHARPRPTCGALRGAARAKCLPACTPTSITTTTAAAAAATSPLPLLPPLPCRLRLCAAAPYGAEEDPEQQARPGVQQGGAQAQAGGAGAGGGVAQAGGAGTGGHCICSRVLQGGRCRAADLQRWRWKLLCALLSHHPQLL